MIIKLLNYIRSGNTYSIDELTRLLDAAPETVYAGLDYLEQNGYIRKVTTNERCTGKCNGCNRCHYNENLSMPVIWEAVQEKCLG